MSEKERARKKESFFSLAFSLVLKKKKRKKVLTHCVGGRLAELLERVGLVLLGLLVRLGGGDLLDLESVIFLLVVLEEVEVGRGRLTKTG